MIYSSSSTTTTTTSNPILSPSSNRAVLSSIDANILPLSGGAQPPTKQSRSLKSMSSKDKLKEWTFPRSSAPSSLNTSTSSSHSSSSTGGATASSSSNLGSYRSTTPQTPTIDSEPEYENLSKQGLVDHHHSSASSGSGSDGETRSEHGRSSSIPPFAKLSTISAVNTPSQRPTAQQRELGSPNTSPFKQNSKDLRHRTNASIAIVAFNHPPTNSPGSPSSQISMRTRGSSRSLTISTPSMMNTSEYPTSISEAIKFVYSNMRRKSLSDLCWLFVFSISIILFASALLGIGYTEPSPSSVPAQVDLVKGTPEFLPKAGQWRQREAPPADVHQSEGDSSHDRGDEFFKDSPNDRTLDDEHVHHHHDTVDALFSHDHVEQPLDDTHHSHDAIIDSGAGSREIQDIEALRAAFASEDYVELDEGDEVNGDHRDDENGPVAEVEAEDEIHPDHVQEDPSGEQEEDVSEADSDGDDHVHHKHGQLRIEEEEGEEEEVQVVKQNVFRRDVDRETESSTGKRMAKLRRR